MAQLPFSVLKVEMLIMSKLRIFVSERGYMLQNGAKMA
jgi:hypothetical protein